MRYHGLDALRGFAMSLGVVLHAMTFYIFSEDPEVNSAFVDITFLWIHAWRMPLFFVLAGFFAALTLEKWGQIRFAKDRALRIGLTFLIFWVLYQDKEMLAQPVTEWPLDHLWFLYYLLLIYPILIFLPKINLAKWPWLWLLIGLVLAILGKDDVFFNRHSETIILDIWNFLYGFYFVLLGWALYPLREKITRIDLWAWPGLILGMAMIFVLAVASEMFDFQENSVFFLGANCLHLIAIFATIIGSVGWVGRYFNSPSRCVSLMVEWSYPVYVFHVFFAYGIFGNLVVDEWGFGAIAGVMIISIFSFSASVITYYVFVKFTPLSWLFNGIKKSRWRWPIKNPTI